MLTSTQLSSLRTKNITLSENNACWGLHYHLVGFNTNNARTNSTQNRRDFLASDHVAQVTGECLVCLQTQFTNYCDDTHTPDGSGPVIWVAKDVVQGVNSQAAGQKRQNPAITSTSRLDAFLAVPHAMFKNLSAFDCLKMKKSSVISNIALT